MSSTTYLVTARKYRPQTFGDVVAQEHVTGTLKNALRLDRLAHAYLFTGPRGVGKTTGARILAKAINCTTPLSERVDGAEPCRTCDSCRSFEEGRNMNIIEIDAASNNKVDDVRDLRETVRVPPQGNRMKVYIIDEVHMLSNAAFNALLKTLEEPPPHALFIFATTEPHKVLPTIQSRCQRFDYRRIAVEEIVVRLKEICETEQISADDASLVLIARKGDGALRDALSVFDQAVSLCGTTITHPELIKALGVVDDDVFFDVTRAVVESSPARMVQIVDGVVKSGYDLQEFVDGLTEHIRNLLVAATLNDTALIEATDAMRKRYLEHAAGLSESTLMALVHQAGQVADTLRNSRQPRLKLEMALIRMATTPRSVDVREALATLDRIEKMAAKGSVSFTLQAPAAPAQGQTPAAPSAPAPAPAAPPKPESKAESASQPEPEPEPVVAREPEPTPHTPPAGTPSRPSGGAPQQESPMALFQPAPAIKRRPKPSGDASAAVMVADDVLVADEPEAPAGEMARLRAAWPDVVSSIMETEKQLGSLLTHTEIALFQDRTVTIIVPDAFHEQTLRADRARLAHRLTDASDIHIDAISFRVVADRTPEAQEEDPEQDARAFLKEQCEKNPAVQSLVERFGGEIVW
ncbi:MAG: DNA polymerase III subunit gamma/tau [Rhodothermales bacterium]